jgi:GMP synthase-like glutamine amidotransferase
MPDSLPDPAATATLTAERVLILDFSSQATQLIPRRLRESAIYSRSATAEFANLRLRLLNIAGSNTENATLPFRCRV